MGVEERRDLPHRRNAKAGIAVHEPLTQPDWRVGADRDLVSIDEPDVVRR